MMVDLGKTPNGTHISVNREVYEADFKIGIGSIVPHYIPGFAGGAKIVQPGISAEQTTAETHLLSTCAPRSFLGIRGKSGAYRIEQHRPRRRHAYDFQHGSQLPRRSGRGFFWRYSGGF